MKYKKLIISTILISSCVIANATSTIDAGGYRIYSKICNIGKWVIIIKGGIETIQKVTAGDFEGAKKNFMSYLLIYASLFALPWGLEEIESIMEGI